MTKEEALKLAKECGATTYTSRHYPEAPAVTFSPLAWEKFCEQAIAAAPVQEQALPEFYAQLEYNSPDWDVFACVYRRRADATPELVHREQLPRQTPAAPVHPVASLLAAIQAEPVTLIHKWRVLELVKDHAAQPAHLAQVVRAHIQDLRACLPTLREHKLSDTAAEVEKAANELEAAAAQPAPVQGWRADVQKVRDSLEPEDWCGDEKMIDVLDRVLAQKPCCLNMAAGTSCLSDPNANCPLLATPPAQPAVQEPVAHLWKCLGRWSAYLVANGDQADCAPPSWLVDAVKKATSPAPVQPVQDLHFFKQVLSVAIAGLYEHYKGDVLKTFSIDELQKVVNLSESLRSRQVEDIYRQMWDMLNTPPAAPVQKQPQNCGTGYCSCIECVMEPAPVQELVGDEWTPCMKLPVVVHVRKQRPGESHVSTREGITPVKPDDLIMRGVSGEEYPIGRAIFEQTYTLDTTPPAQPAVPDAITDNSENPEYRAGWNECRQAMLQIMKARTL